MTTTAQADINTSSSVNSGNGNGDSVGAGVGVGVSDVGGNCDGNARINTKHLNNNNNNNNNNNSTNSKNNNIPNSNNIDLQRVSECKRKKVKSRNAVPQHSDYAKHHLDAWLETCLKDASNTQLSSSSEFLDYNPSAVPHSATTMAAVAASQAMNSKNIFGQQQLQMQQQQLLLQQAYPGLLPKTNLPNFPTSSQAQQQQQPTAQRYSYTQPPQMSYTSGYSAPFGQGIQRHMPSKMSQIYNNRYSSMFPSGGFLPHNNGSQDFASLPPLVNMMGGGGTSEHENNSTDVLDGSGSNPNISQGFRFSDPCLLNPSDNDDSKVSGQNTPDRRQNVSSEMENNKFFAALMEQINLLHETNSKICRNLHETKVDIEALKHTPNWGMRHRRDSVSGLSTHSQPMAFGGGAGFGRQSPAPTYHSGAYTPGMMTDVVREVKEAARVREDALLNRVKAMVEERQWSMNECSMRMMRDIEELKSQIHHLRTDRKEANKRISHLEAENKYMRQMLANVPSNNRNAPDIIYENETLHTILRKPSTQHTVHPTTRRSQSLNLHYGTIHHQPPPPSTTLLLEEEQQHHVQDSALHINESGSSTTASDALALRPAPEMRSSFSSSDGGGSISGGGIGIGVTTVKLPNGTPTAAVMSPPNFALVSTPADEVNQRRIDAAAADPTTTIAQRQIAATSNQATNEQLKEELNAAMVARKEADKRIIALEKLVKTLQLNTIDIHPSEVAIPSITNGDGGVSVGDFSRNHTSSNTLKWQPSATAITCSNVITVPFTSSNIGNINNKHHQAQTIASNSIITTTQPSPKLSVAGPITDL